MSILCHFSLKGHDDDPQRLVPKFFDVYQEIRDSLSDLVDVMRENTASVSALADAQRQAAEAFANVSALVDAQRQTAAAINRIADIILEKQQLV